MPYWDYYTTPGLPAEFLSPASNNPLYLPRTNSNVSQALTLAPFSNTLTALPRGYANAYEAALENAPHNPVHDLIGGVMADMQSPMDPIFWLHHANIDRLWSAWVAAANGRQMPAKSAAYWNGTFNYASGLTLPRRSTYDTRNNLFYYYYDKETLPIQLPPGTAAAAEADATRPPEDEAAPTLAPPQGRAPGRLRRPPIGPFAPTGMRQRGAGRLALGGASKVSLERGSVSAALPLSRAAHATLQQVLAAYLASPFGPSGAASPAYTQIEIVLDQPRATAAALAGGFFYKLYLNLPDDPAGTGTDADYYLGTLGPFQLAGLRHHEQMGHALLPLSFPATTLLQRFRGQDLSAMTLAFVRVDGDRTPAGEAITIAQCRIEVTVDDSR